MTQSFDIVILGLTITSSWGNGHATTYRSLVRGLAGLGCNILFLERDRYWYAENRDTPHPDGATTIIYSSLDELTRTYETVVADADLVIIGSFVPDGIAVGDWVTSVATGKVAFYDIDTPITLASLANGSNEYLTPALIAQYDAYFSFTGGPSLRHIEQTYGSPMARALYCSVDTDLYRPVSARARWDLGYLGTYSDDRQPAVDELLLSPARHLPASRFIVAGPQYPEHLVWPPNVEREIHLSPREHPAFYAAQRYTLNITREAMKAAGYSPSVRLFEAAACGTPIISDWWEGLDSILTPNKEILISQQSEDVERILRELPEQRRLEIASAARRRILAEHTPATRALQVKSYLEEMHDHTPSGAPRRHGRHRQTAGWFRTGLDAKHRWKSQSGAVGQESHLHQTVRHLLEPGGARS